MAVTFPYATTVNGLNATVTQLRAAFPAKVNAETLKKLGIAPGNESSILQTLRFVRLINDEGDKQADAAKAFVVHENEKFAEAFEPLVRKAYASLFETLGDGAWNAGRDQLITFFRQSDQTSARVGEQQAATFLALAAFAGHGEVPAASGNGGKRAAPASPRRSRERAPEKPQPALAMQAPVTMGSGVNVTVRVELNVPVTDNKEVYDKLFRSIRENLVDA
jgi:hypothetical protein